MSKEEVRSFLASVHKLGLRNLAYEETPPKGVYVMDGVSWIFEEVNQGNYHVIVRVSPRGGPMFELGSGMMNWSKHSQ